MAARSSPWSCRAPAGRRAAAGGKGPAYGGEPQISHDQPRPGSYLTVSIGVSTLVPGGGGQTFRVLIEMADQALYQAKNNGRKPGWPDGTTGAAGPGGLSGARRPCVAGRH